MLEEKIHIEHSLENNFLSGKALVEYLDGCVVVCSDVVPYSRERGTVILPIRIHKPAEGIWVIGGRTQKGERAAETVIRRLEKETGLKVGESRLQHLGSREFMWAYRSEAPGQENGRHDLNRIFALEVSDAEVEIMRKGLESKEYDLEQGFTEYTREDLIAANARECIIDYYDAIFSGDGSEN